MKAQLRRYKRYNNTDKNNEADRSITSQLYGGDNEHRLKQEIMLGIGGMAALKELGISKEVYHCNEGHAAFLNVQRLIDYIRTGLSFNEAMEITELHTKKTVFTAHYKDYRIFENTIEHAIDTMTASGISAKALKHCDDEKIVYTITIDKMVKR